MNNYFELEKFYNETISQEKDEKLLRKLLKENNINEKPEYDYTYLHMASKSGHAPIAKICIDVGADVNACTDNGTTPLHMAAWHGHPEVVRLLLEQPNVDVNAVDTDGFTPLHMAAWHGHPIVVEQLLQKSEIDVNAIDIIDGLTPLHMAAWHGRPIVVEQLLQKSKINVNAVDLNEETPLHAAAKNGYHEVVRRLLKQHNIDVNVLDMDEFTPLHLAVGHGRDKVVRELLLHPTINVNAFNNHKDTALHFAARKIRSERLKRRHQQTALYNPDKVLRRLLQHPGINVNALRNNGGTPLHAAVESGNAKAVERFLNQPQIQVNATDRNGQTPLDIAFAYENRSRHNEERVSMVSMLLAFGAPMDTLPLFDDNDPLCDLLRACDLHSNGTDRSLYFAILNARGQQVVLTRFFNYKSFYDEDKEYKQKAEELWESLSLEDKNIIKKGFIQSFPSLSARLQSFMLHGFKLLKIMEGDDIKTLLLSIETEEKEQNNNLTIDYLEAQRFFTKEAVADVYHFSRLNKAFLKSSFFSRTPSSADSERSDTKRVKVSGQNSEGSSFNGNKFPSDLLKEISFFLLPIRDHQLQQIRLKRTDDQKKVFKLLRELSPLNNAKVDQSPAEKASTSRASTGEVSSEHYDAAGGPDAAGPRHHIVPGYPEAAGWTGESSTSTPTP